MRIWLQILPWFGSVNTWILMIYYQYSDCLTSKSYQILSRFGSVMNTWILMTSYQYSNCLTSKSYQILSRFGSVMSCQPGSQAEDLYSYGYQVTQTKTNTNWFCCPNWLYCVIMMKMMVIFQPGRLAASYEGQEQERGEESERKRKWWLTLCVDWIDIPFSNLIF